MKQYVRALFALSVLSVLSACATSNAGKYADNTHPYIKDRLNLNRTWYEGLLSSECYLQIGMEIVASGQEAVDRYRRDRVGNLYAAGGKANFWGPNAGLNRGKVSASYPFDMAAGDRWCFFIACVSYIDWEGGTPYYEVKYVGPEMFALNSYPTWNYPGYANTVVGKWGKPLPNVIEAKGRGAIPLQESGISTIPSRDWEALVRSIQRFDAKQSTGTKERSVPAKILATAGGLLYSLNPISPWLEFATREADHGPGIGGRLIGDTYFGDFSADLTPEELEALIQSNEAGAQHRAALRF